MIIKGIILYELLQIRNQSVLPEQRTHNGIKWQGSLFDLIKELILYTSIDFLSTR